MPWDVKKRGSQYCVVKQGESKPVPGGCHSTKAKARAHQRALYASESADADTFGVYPDGVEGSDMAITTTSNSVSGGFTVVPMVNTAGQTIGWLRDDSTETLAETQPVEKPWSGILAVVGSPTSDGRYLLPGEISNRDLPIPLQVQTVTAEGHMGSSTAGRIDSIDFVPLSEFDRKDEYNLDGVREDAVVAFGTGMLDGSDAASEAERLIANGAGVSIDLPPDRMALIDPQTFEEVDPAEVDMGDVLAGKYLTGIGGKIAAATIVTVPAFEEAEIALTEEDSVLIASAYGQHVMDDEPLTHEQIRAAFEGIGVLTDKIRQSYTDEEFTLVAAAAPLKPDRSWFDDPSLSGLTPLTVTKEGRVYGHLADWDGCHTGFSNVCVPPFRSSTDYAYFNTGEIECDDGTLVAVGKLMFSMDGGKHAPTSLGFAEASKHYDDSTKVAAFVRAGTDRYGTWLAGALRHGLSEEEVQHVRSHPPSGDWRPIPGKGTELVAAFCVAVGGFPIPRAMVASGEAGELTIISAPLDLTPGPHAVRRRLEVLKRKRRSKKRDEDTSMADANPLSDPAQRGT
jgi:hypothetical protein